MKNLFPSDELQEEQPPGFVAWGEIGLVCRLKKRQHMA